MKERRKDPRFVVYWPLRAGHRTQGSTHGHVVNVSGPGFLFIAADEFAIDDLVEMEITINALFIIRCAARIVRGEKMEGEWAFGAVFHSLSTEDASVLAQTLVAIQAGQSDNDLSFRPKAPLLAT
jgi:hypothetical protein